MVERVIILEFLGFVLELAYGVGQVTALFSHGTNEVSYWWDSATTHVMYNCSESAHLPWLAKMHSGSPPTTSSTYSVIITITQNLNIIAITTYFIYKIPPRQLNTRVFVFVVTVLPVLEDSVASKVRLVGRSMTGR